MYYELTTVGNQIAMICGGLVVGMLWMGVFWLADMKKKQNELNRFLSDNKLMNRWIDFKIKEKSLK